MESSILTPKKNHLNFPILNKLPKDLKNKKIIICCTKNAQEIYFDLIEKFSEDRIIAIDSPLLVRKNQTLNRKIIMKKK